MSTPAQRTRTPLPEIGSLDATRITASASGKTATRSTTSTGTRLEETALALSQKQSAERPSSSLIATATDEKLLRVKGSNTDVHGSHISLLSRSDGKSRKRSMLKERHDEALDSFQRNIETIAAECTDATRKLVDQLETAFAENTEIDLILARAGDPAQIVRLKRTEVEAMEGEVEHAIQAQLAQINRAETDLMNVENQRADQLQQTLIQFDHDLRNAAYLLPEETQHMVQQHTVEFNQQVLDNRKALLQFCTQIRMARADRQDKALKELVRLRREVWSPERTQHLLDDFQATMATFSSTKEREALEAFHVRYDEIYVEQLNVIRQVAKMNPAQMSLDGFRVAIERAEAITTKDFQQHFEKLFRDLRANDDKIHTLQKEKVEQLTVALYDCNNGKVPANAKKMIDSLYDKDKTVRMATIQRLAIESITQQTRQNADSLLRFCEYARRTFQIWEEHQREISKLPETLTKNLEEIRAMHGSDLVRQEEEMRKIVLDMRNKDDNVSALQTSMEKLRISLDCIKEVYEAQHETCVRTMGAHTAIIEQQLLDCKTELFTFLGVSAPNVNDTTPVQSTEALAADDVVSGATLDGVAMEPVVAVVIPQKLAHREPRRQSARGRRKAAQVVAHSSRMHNDDMHFAKYDTDFGSYQLAHTDLLFIQQQLHRWQLFMTESKRRILIDPEEIEAERLRKEEEAKQAALTNRPVKSDRGTAPIDINTILEYVPPTLKPVAAMPTTTKMIEGGAKKLETPYLRVKLLDTSVIQELQETLQRTWIGFLEELETSKVSENATACVKLRAKFQNELNECLYLLEPRYEQYRKEVFDVLIDEMSAMREKQINESKQLAKLMIDTRLNFNNSFVEVDGMVEKYITAIHQLQDKLIKDTTTPKLKQVQAVEKEFDAIKDKWLGKMKSTISNAVHAFKTNYATLQTAEFQSEQTIKTGNSKTAGLTAKQRKKLATSMSKKQIWDNAVTMATEMIRRVNLTSSTDFLKIDLDDFLAAYHDRVEDVQHMTEASSKACAQLIEAYRVETAFLESVDKLVHDAEAKIKFEIYQNENICRDLKAKVQSAQGALQKWQYLVGKNMVAVQCFSGYYISHIQRDSESMKEATEKSMADELLTTYSLLEDLRAALAHQAAFLGGIEIEGGSFMAEKRILADLQKFMMVVTGQSDTATTIRAFHQRTAVLDTVIRVFPAYAEETFAALRTEVELRTTDFFATKQGPVAIVGRLGSNAVDYMVIFSQALQEKAAKNLEYRNECLRDLRQQVDTWHTLLPNFISNSFTFLRSKAEEDSIAFRKLQSTSYSQLKETLRSRKDTNWSKLVPSLGHPQNIGKLQDLDVEEAARAKQTLDAVQAYTTRIRDNFTATSHKYHEWNVYVADALFGLLDEAVQQEDLERDVTAVIPSDESTKQTMERSSRRAIAAELIRQQREREEKSKLEPQSDRIPEEPAVENPVDVVIVADVPSKRQVIYEQFTLLADSERPLVLRARSTELHRLVAAECARNALRYEEFLGRALQEMDTVLCSTTDEETVWAGKWRASVAKIKSIYQ